MAQQLRTHIVLGEDPVLVPSTHAGWFIMNSCNSRSGDLDLSVLKGHLQKLMKVHTHILI